MDQRQPQVEYRDEPPLREPWDSRPGLVPSLGGAPADTRWDGRHFINIRLSIPLVFMRVYVTLVAGKERRDDARRRAEREKHPLRTWGNMFLFGYSGALFGLAFFAIVIIATVLAINHFFDIDITLR